MAYVQPDYNILANLFSVALPSSLSFRTQTVCNLALGRRVNFPVGAGVGSSFGGFYMTLLVPPLTDIRDGMCAPGNNGDVVEVPAGSGRWYTCLGVDDVGKGFTNEHRAAALGKIGAYGQWVALGIPWWPAPIP